MREFLLTTVNGASLPNWTAGAHIALHLTSPTRGLVVRHYSLIGGDGLRDDPPNTYRIAVQREEHGFGSNLIHETFKAGTTLRIGPPVNSFALDREASKVLLLAGGIGITPLVPMARSLLRRKRAFQMVYSGRSVDQMAYAKNLQEMCGSVLSLQCSDTDGMLDIKGLPSSVTSGLPLYVPKCGIRPSTTVAMTSARPPKAASGSPPPMLLARVTRSGFTPSRCAFSRSVSGITAL